jgi:hypothetical protein
MLAWHRFMYGSSLRRARVHCYERDVQKAFDAQRAYMRLLADALTTYGRQPSTAFEPIGSEAEYGSGFCFTYNQVHVSWSRDDIAGIFYVNDTLSPALLEDAEIVGGSAHQRRASTGADAAAWRRVRELAEQTKLLPPSVRGDAWRQLSVAQRAELAHSLRDVALREAAAAHERARRASEMVAAAGGPRDLPIVQYQIDQECFDPASFVARADAIACRGRRCLP